MLCLYLIFNLMEFVSEKSERLDKFLASRLKQYSRTQLQRFIKAGAIKINGHPVIKPGFELRAKDRIVVLEEVILSEAKNLPFVIEPEPDIPLEVVYEDKDIAVINKPAGLLVHPTLGQPRHTLANALVARYSEIIKVGESPLRPGIVHRLDKDTSGLIVAAKNQEAFLYMKELFLKRAVTKKYMALVEGVPKAKEGVIEYDIRPSKAFRLKKVAVQRAEPQKKSRRAAKTEYKIRKVIADKFALVEVSPLTGRTHQIRVHLAAIGHPVVGDRLYGSRTKIKRQFLHAYYLKFIAPNGTPLALEIGLPKDLEKILEAVAN